MTKNKHIQNKVHIEIIHYWQIQSKTYLNPPRKIISPVLDKLGGSRKWSPKTRTPGLNRNSGTPDV